MLMVPFVGDKGFSYDTGTFWAWASKLATVPINEFYAEITPIIIEAGGFIDEFTGDGVKALFLDDATQAVDAAVAMHRIVREHEFDSTDSGGTRLGIGIGMHSGKSLLGTVGAAERMSTTAIGDTVNVAARVEGLTKQFSAQLLVTGETAELVGESYRLRHAGVVQLVGRVQPVTVYEVFDAMPDAMRNGLMEIDDRFGEAIAAFYAQNFSRSIELFEACLHAVPRDATSLRFLERARRFSGIPLQPGWDGVEVLDSK